MAIIPATKYPGRTDPASPAYPQGSAKNVAVPGDGTGTPWEKDIVNDIFGLQQAILSSAGVTPSGNPDTAEESQYLDALKSIFVSNVENTEDILTMDLSKEKSIVTSQYNSSIGNGSALWKATGVTTPGNAGTTDFGNGLIYDSEGTEFRYSNEVVYVDALGGEIQNALDFAGQSGYPRIVHCGDQSTTTTITVPNNVHFTTGTVEYTGSTPDIPIVSMGDNSNGVLLTRTAKISFIRAKDSSSQAGVVGIQIGNYVRSSDVIHCVAEMSEPVNGSLGQVGFEIASWFIGAPGITNVGTYGNTIQSCLALFAHTGYRVRTFGTMVEELGDPQANGNFIKECHAFSCRRRAVYLSYGAQENEFDVRADTFPDQTGLGTTVNVLDIDGRYNAGKIVEEVGAIADTQHSVRIGDEAIYNQIDVSTQQVVTSIIDDSASPEGKRAKNIIKQSGPGLISRGRPGSEGTEGFYEAVASSQVQAVQKLWIAPAKCVVTKIMGRLSAAAPAGGDTRIYFAKNSVFATNNRVTWAAAEAVSVKSVTTDTSASVDIGSQWVLDEGDYISMAVDTPGGGGVTATGTFFVRYI